MKQIFESFLRQPKSLYLYGKIYARFKTQNKLKTLKGLYQKLNDDDIFFLPRIIHIETRTKCSGGCSFCLASYKTDPRVDGSMSDEMVNNILSQLAELNYSNRLSFYNNNEPFLDKRIYKYIKLARDKLPNAFLELKTNGKGLKLENVLEIFSNGLDYLNINDYVDYDNFNNKNHSKSILKLKNQLEKIRRFKGNYLKNNSFERINISLRFEGAVLNTRAGSAPNRNAEINSNHTKFKSKDWLCFRPFEMITINKDGHVALCSEDLLFQEKMGDINKTKIIDIWLSKKYKKIRYELMKGNRECLSTCSKCDYKGFTNEAFLENNL